MAKAAVPDYLGKDFHTASPGLRFGMYLQIWSGNFLKEKEKVDPLKKAGKLTDNDQRIMASLLARQQASLKAVSNGTNSTALDAISTSPFTTGLGNEHPLENGFAFLNPYGLPYLPGSGVKGVLRQAARELASGEWGETHGWSDDTITLLFGKESQDGDSDHLRGALTFWDVIPQIKGDHLTVEIMTPHQKHYYQDGQSPHDSGQPIPIYFLTVPPGSGFKFHVQCNLILLQCQAPDLANNGQWQPLLQAAFKHAFNWLGFGAKTAAGYGAMHADIPDIEVWVAAELKSANPGSGDITIASSDGRKTATGKFYSDLSDTAKKRLKKKQKVILDAHVEPQGNLIRIKTITERNQHA